MLSVHIVRGTWYRARALAGTGAARDGLEPKRLLELAAFLGISARGAADALVPGYASQEEELTGRRDALEQLLRSAFGARRSALGARRASSRKKGSAAL